MRKILILFLFILSLGTLYILIDKHLYYYGRNDLHIYSPLPFRVHPEYWGYQQGMLGFVLLKDDITHIAKGVRYFDCPDIKIDSVLSYGFNKKK